MVDTINFRPAVKTDIPQLIELMNSQYIRKKDEAYFLWQYFNSFYPTILMCAFFNTKLIGMFGLQERELENGAHVGHAIDMLVAHKWRGRGVFQLLGEKATDYVKNLDLLCVLPNVNGKYACEKKLGWRTLGRINLMYLEREYLKNITEKPLRIFPDMNGQIFSKFKYNAENRFWRFDEHPEYIYNYVRLQAGEFAVTKIFKDPVTGSRYGDIVDFECNLNNRELLAELFRRACIYLREQEVEGITTWSLKNAPLRDSVESLGFIEIKQERYFCLKVLTPAYEYLNDLSCWHLVQSDAEIY